MSDVLWFSVILYTSLKKTTVHCFFSFFQDVPKKGGGTSARQEGELAESDQARETCSRWQARENLQPVASAGKLAAGAKCGKIYLNTTGTKGGETCNRCQAREDIEPVPNAGKPATCAKRCSVLAYKLRKRHVYHDWSS